MNTYTEATTTLLQNLTTDLNKNFKSNGRLMILQNPETKDLAFKCSLRAKKGVREQTAINTYPSFQEASSALING